MIFIIVEYKDGVRHEFTSFEDLLNLENYNELIDFNCCLNGITKLPKLPTSLVSLTCKFNRIQYLPELPDSLKILDCASNKLSILPKLPNSLEYINCSDNQIPYLPNLPPNLKELHCSFIILPLNKNFPEPKTLTTLPLLPKSLESLYCSNNSIYEYIKKYFNNDWTKYREYQYEILVPSANKIGEWYIECKYNPKYKKCRERLENEYKQIYDENDNN